MVGKESMNVFTWLLIGHLVGDWLLQNDWMAKGKKEGLITLAGLAHFTIYTIVVTLALWISKQNQPLECYLIFGLFVFISHWLIDATNIVDFWIRFYRQSNLLLMRIMVDQIFHILVLAILSIIITMPIVV